MSEKGIKSFVAKKLAAGIHEKKAAGRVRANEKN
jgi:hypothetical protein